MSGWDESSGWDAGTEKNEGRTKPVYSQSFSRGGRGNNRSNRSDRNSNDDWGNNQNDRRGGGFDRRNQNNDTRRNGYGKNNSSSSTWENTDSNSTDGQTNSDSKVININTKSVGKVIGRGGSKIKQLESESGARININKTNRGDQTEVTLTGYADQVEKASQLIEELMLDDYQGQQSQSGQQSYSGQQQSQSGQQEYSGQQPRENRYSSNRYNQDNSSWSNNNYTSNSNYPSNNPDESQNDQRKSNYRTPIASNLKQDDLINWDSVYKQSADSAAEYLASLPPVIKNLYYEDPEVANMTPQEVEKFRSKNMNISVARVFAEPEEGESVPTTNHTQKPIPNPITTFEHAFRRYPEILKTIREQKFETPSPIQCQSWPVIMSGEDLIGIAQTGTGKTLAFLLPALLHIEIQPVPRNQRKGPTVLILSPTRELAIQIEKEMNKYSYQGIKSLCVYGGGSRRDQLTWYLRERPEIVVGTPGRLDDFVAAKEILLDSVTYLVMDEADKMLELGFEPQIRKILLYIRGDRQTIMTSATWPPGVRRLGSQYTTDPVQVVVGSLDLTAVHTITQRIELIDEEDKRERLHEFLINMDPEDKVIVFCGKKSVTDDISSTLILHNIPCQSIHGDREQCDREQALEDLKTGEVRILIATDVAARGLDIVDITHIFNYDFPKNIEEYVHRIGRTGRAGRTGEAISLVTRRDWGNAADLIKILQEANQGVPEELFDMADRFEKKKRTDHMDRRGGRGGGGGRGRGGRGRGRY